MCGIAGGFWTRPELALSREVLQRMTTVLQHRGPDGEGYYEQAWLPRPPYDALPGVALGHRRLAVLDLATGQQPLSNETGTIWVVFNGEIYNFEALRRRLQGAGHTFRTQSDTETIVHLYEDEGLDCFSHLNGMFAMAIYDRPQRRLILARDRLGKKPLVYHHAPGRVLFASEIKSLLQVPEFPREIDPAAVDAYLMYQYVPHPRTIFAGIQKLPPAHYAVFQDDRCEIKPYWQPDFNAEEMVSQSHACAQLRELLTSAVQLRLRSDVPLGAFLSGGVDSSLLVALAQRELKQPLKTFTIGFDAADYDERSQARIVAQHVGTEHYEEVLSPQAIDLLPRLVATFDEPFADSSAIPTWYLSELTRRQVTVALSGDGGDELFLGYPRYQAARWAHYLDRLPWLKRILGASVWQSLPSSSQQKSRWRQCKRFSESLRLSPARRYADWISIFNEQRRGDLYTPEFVEQIGQEDPFQFLQTAWQRANRRDCMTSAALADVSTYLPCDLLTKVDITSMAHGLEVRQPLLDYRVVEFAARLPAALKSRWGRGKRLLQAAFGDLLPAAVWQRKKMGFGVPLDRWFRQELREQVAELTSPQAPLMRQGWFQTAVVQRLINEHQQQQFDHSARLWSLLVLNEWLRTFG
jgi:asparagine synthase (glutamine-hydrolysing)